jgi:uncharacterized membrane protein YtjA (UPF0391 family)
LTGSLHLAIRATKFGRNNSVDQAFSEHANLLRRKEIAMLGWAVTFLIIALIAAVLGFGGIAGVAIEAAKLVFFVAVVLFLIAALVGIVRGRTPRIP